VYLTSSGALTLTNSAILMRRDDEMGETQVGQMG
jgi:hypothetical protein